MGVEEGDRWREASVCMFGSRRTETLTNLCPLDCGMAISSHTLRLNVGLHCFNLEFAKVGDHGAVGRLNYRDAEFLLIDLRLVKFPCSTSEPSSQGSL